MNYKPDRIYLDKELAQSGLITKILQKFPNQKPILLDNSSIGTLEEEYSHDLSQGKKILHLKNYRGKPVKLCPGFSESLLCCNYFVIDLIENCPLECSYCILQAFLNKPVITFHANVEEIIGQLRQVVLSEPERRFRIGTGEHSDSLALDWLFEVNPTLVETFANLPNATLELKTKTDLIEPLLGLEHNQRTVISWSLNPVEIIKKQEQKTASLVSRLKAAQRVQSGGYPVAFHFDPVIYYPGWEEGYKEVINLMFEYAAPDKIAWISLGALRFIPELKNIAQTRFPKTGIFSEEFIQAEDGKMRYLKPIRMEILDSLTTQIRKKAPKIPLYLCMEKHSLWNKFMPCHPKNPEELEEYLHRNLP